MVAPLAVGAGAVGTTRPNGAVSCRGKKVFPTGRYFLWFKASLIRRVATSVAPQPAAGKPVVAPEDGWGRRRPSAETSRGGHLDICTHLPLY